MRKQTHRFLTRLLATTLSVALLCVAGGSIPASSGAKRITVVYTNDTMGTVEPCG